MEPCCEYDVLSWEYTLRRETDGDDMVLKEMGMDLDGEEPGEVSKCMADGRVAGVALR